jgi:hypothetical protein
VDRSFPALQTPSLLQKSPKILFGNAQLMADAVCNKLARLD